MRITIQYKSINYYVLFILIYSNPDQDIAFLDFLDSNRILAILWIQCAYLGGFLTHNSNIKVKKFPSHFQGK